MDTATHLVMGIGLFGLAHLDPAVASDTETAQAVLLSTVIGSEIPDIDTLYRFRGNALYIRKHRGFSHSLPMLIIWPLLLTAGISLLFPGAIAHCLLWSFLAVFIHIFIDIFNTYGTQALRPFSHKWLSWNTLNIFDPFIFTLHLISFGLWRIMPDRPVPIYTMLYLILIAYIAWRSIVHFRLTERVKREVSLPGRYTVTPTVRWNVWNVIVETKEKVKVGEIRNGCLAWTGEMKTEDLNHPAALQSKKADSIEAFLSFTSYGYPQVMKRPYGYEVRWLDVRYHYKKHFPFVAVALLDQHYNIFYSFVGWMNEEQLEKKVKHLS
ncbi:MULTISPECIES: metal-dependent hydrolase [Thermoactinomyces]|jgi:inner membrane protein|uniref:Metal-dependent hydrolase n=1 Tax=Thermoactinomyces daqus TaxID=1329516 RepID=A0A7W1XB38_9BACL|nr:MULTISPECIES: metal-dependent hydrolase [Thermoactinomyces]MBA4543366.1 metal-dependent hydrolase [Thermoactinomyces daqus]MBH8599480.1 metal-dependent hydrolase [Thermoactinomyces sp. CICC 10523]MBH8605268.1 metal-dependent hydrolase [Thermoactinomyces sp. CICC 10522]MBH8608149.1 metal-dependent hydrolase [Thermoactinomyces sp. CICC 10521]